MENPYELIEARLSRIETLIETLIESNDNSLKPDNNLIGNIDDCSGWIKIPKATLYKLTSQRKIPHIKQGKHLLFNKSDIINWLYKNKKMTYADLDDEVNNELYDLGKVRN